MPLADRVVLRSRYTFADTVDHLANAIVAGGNTLFATIDQAAVAKGVGLDLRPTTLLIFGNPKGGTPLMEACPPFALELPLKLVVWEDADGVSVAHPVMAQLAQRYGIAGADPHVVGTDHALDALTALVSAAPKS